MVRTLSTMLALGTEAPHFSLPDVVSGRTVSLDSFKDSKALLVMFICRHCPYVAHVREGLARMADDYADADLGMVAICANDPAEYPEDAPESLAEEGRIAGYRFPYNNMFYILEAGGNNFYEKRKAGTFTNDPFAALAYW